MQSIGRAIAILLLLTIGFGLPSLSAQAEIMDGRLAVATVNQPPSGECLTCESEHSTMSPTACFVGCLGTPVEALRSELRFELGTRSFRPASENWLRGRASSPDPYPPRAYILV